jgi:hypothetical protein
MLYTRDNKEWLRFVYERVGIESSTLSLYHFILYKWTKECARDVADSTSFRYSQGEIVVSNKANAHNSTEPVELWKDWNEKTTRMRSSILDSRKEAYKDSFDFYNLWMRPVTFFKLWYDATSEVWAQVAREVMNSEQFLEANCQFIEAYMSVVRTSLLVNEGIFQNLQISTRADTAQVAKLVDSLEERVYTIEDAFVNFEDGYLKAATDQMVEELGGHLERVEGKLDTLDALSSILQQTEAIGDLAGRLERVEGKLNTLLVALEKIEALESGWSSDEGEVHCQTQEKRDGTQRVKDTELEMRHE